MKKIFLLGCLFLLLSFANSIKAQTRKIIFTDEFNDLTNWQVHLEGTAKAIPSNSLVFSGENSLWLSKQGIGSRSYLERIFQTPQTGEVVIYFYDDYDPSISPKSTLGSFISLRQDDDPTHPGIMVGVKSDLYPDHYYARIGLNDQSSGFNTQIPRTKGWHQFSLVVTPNGSYAKIDGFSLSYYPQNIDGGSGGGIAKNLTSFTKIVIALPWNNLDAPAFWDKLEYYELPVLPNTFLERSLDLQKSFLEDYAQTSSDFYSPQGLYKGNDVAARTLSSTSIVAAVVYSKTNDSRWQKIGLDCLKSVANNYDLWKTTMDSSRYTTNAISSFEMASLLWWPNLDQGLKDKVKNIIANEAGIIINRVPFVETGYIDDSKSETNSWLAAALSLAFYLYPEHPDANRWEQYARVAAFHTFTTSTDNKDSLLGLETQTLRDDFSLDNHYFPLNADYAIGGSIQGLSEGALAYFKANKPIPEEFKHHVLDVWNKHKSYLDLNTLLYINNPQAGFYGGKTDNGWGAETLNGGLAYLDKIFNIPLVNQTTASRYYLYRKWRVFPKDGGPWVCRRYWSRTDGKNENNCGPGANYTFDDIRLLNSVIAAREALEVVWFDDQLGKLPEIPGDINNDQKVDIFDLRYFLANFLKIFTIFDYNKLVENFGSP